MRVQGVYINADAWSSTYCVDRDEVKDHATEMFRQVLEDFVSEHRLNLDSGMYELRIDEERWVFEDDEW